MITGKEVDLRNGRKRKRDECGTKDGSERKSSGCFGNVVLPVKQRPLRLRRSWKRVLMGHLGRQVLSTENKDYALAKLEGLLQAGTSVGLHSGTLSPMTAEI